MPRRPLAFSLILTLAMALAACERDAATPADPGAAATEADAPVMPPDAPPQEEVPQEGLTATACAAEIGAPAAQALADRCRAVSPATHPPCHVDNPCGLIRDEIARACALFDDAERPAACAG